MTEKKLCQHCLEYTMDPNTLRRMCADLPHDGRRQIVFGESNQMLSGLAAEIMDHIYHLGVDDPWIESIHYNTTKYKGEDGEPVTWHDALVVVSVRRSPA